MHALHLRWPELQPEMHYYCISFQDRLNKKLKSVDHDGLTQIDLAQRTQGWET